MTDRINITIASTFCFGEGTSTTARAAYPNGRAVEKTRHGPGGYERRCSGAMRNGGDRSPPRRRDSDPHRRLRQVRPAPGRADRRPLRRRPKAHAPGDAERVEALPGYCMKPKVFDFEVLYSHTQRVFGW